MKQSVTRSIKQSVTVKQSVTIKQSVTVKQSVTIKQSNYETVCNSLHGYVEDKNLHFLGDGYGLQMAS